MAELAPAALQIDGLIALLHDGRRARSRSSRSLVRELNARCSRGSGRCSRRPSWSPTAASIVMGSEGRGEQILKTDQDNALLLRDGFACDRARRA